MEVPWGALLTAALSGIGFIVWLTKISVKQDMGLDTMKKIETAITVIENGYVKKEEFSEKLGEVKVSVKAAWEKIDSHERVMSAMKSEILNAINNHNQ